LSTFSLIFQKRLILIQKISSLKSQICKSKSPNKGFITQSSNKFEITIKFAHSLLFDSKVSTNQMIFLLYLFFKLIFTSIVSNSISKRVYLTFSWFNYSRPTIF